MGVTYSCVCQGCGCTFNATLRSAKYCSQKCRNDDRTRITRAKRQQEEKDAVDERRRTDLLSREYISVTQAAELLGVSRPTIYKRIDAGDIEVLHLTPRTVRIRVKDLTDPTSTVSRLDTPVPEIRKIRSSLVPLSEVAEKYGISYSTLYLYVHTNNLKSETIKGIAYYKLKELEAVISKEQVDGVNDWYTVDEICARTGLKKQQVYDRVSHHKIPRRQVGKYAYISKFDWDRITGMADTISENYYTAREVMAKYGCSFQKVYYTAEQENIPTVIHGRVKHFQKEAIDRIFTNQQR